MPDNQYTNCYFQSEILSKDILGYLIQDKDFDLSDVIWDESKIDIPDDLISSWKKDVDPVTIDELTSRQAFGTGIFDAIMESIHNHLKIEYESGRITGAEYATTYTKLTEAGLANAVKFCLEKNQAYYNGVLAQAQAVTAGIQAQIAALTAKVQLAKTKAEALGVAAQYALTTMKLATEDAQHALVCKQKALIEAQIEAETERVALTQAQTALTYAQKDSEIVHKTVLDQQALVYQYQAQANDPKATAGPNSNVDYLTKLKNMDHIDNQIDLEDAQKELYEQQKHSYLRNDEQKVASLYSNVYTVLKTIDEGIAIPDNFNKPTIDSIFTALHNNVNLGTTIPTSEDNESNSDTDENTNNNP